MIVVVRLGEVEWRFLRHRSDLVSLVRKTEVKVGLSRFALEVGKNFRRRCFRVWEEVGWNHRNC